VSISTDSGQIRSPGFSVNPYPDIMICSWLINPPSDKSVRLFFTDFQTELDKDFVKVINVLPTVVDIYTCICIITFVHLCFYVFVGGMILCANCHSTLPR
jgi:hypothetical protein